MVVGRWTGPSAPDEFVFPSPGAAQSPGFAAAVDMPIPATDGSLNNGGAPRDDLDMGVEQDLGHGPDEIRGVPQTKTGLDGHISDQTDGGLDSLVGDHSNDRLVDAGQCGDHAESCLTDGSAFFDQAQTDAGLIDDAAQDVSANPVEPDPEDDAVPGSPDEEPIGEALVAVCSASVECAQFCQDSVHACVEQCAGHSEPIAQRVLTSYLSCARNHDCILRSQRISSECMATHCLRETVACRGRAYLDAEAERGRCGDYLTCVDECPPHDGACIATCWQSITDASRHLIVELSDCVGSADCETFDCAADACPDEWNHCVGHNWPQFN